MPLFNIKKLVENAGKSTEGLTKNAINDALAEQKSKEAVISMRDALQIMYCLMSVDGKITEEEKDKFEEIGIAYDPYFASYKDSLIEECQAALQQEKAYGHAFDPQTPEDEKDYYYQTYHCVRDLISKNELNVAGGVRAKILLWDLLAIAFSEGDYSTNENRLIRYFAMRAGVEQAVLLEMEQTIRTLAAIEREEEWLKSTDRPYKVIEERVNELADRKNTIMQGVNALIAD